MPGVLQGIPPLSARPPLAQERPPRVPPRLTTAPKLGHLYWCDFWRDAQLPEMLKTRPVIVLSYKNSMHGSCLVVPMTTAPLAKNRWALELSTSIDGRKSWALCNHLCTIAASRLPFCGKKAPSVDKAEFNEILVKVTNWLPRPFALDKPADLND